MGNDRPQGPGFTESWSNGTHDQVENAHPEVADDGKRWYASHRAWLTPSEAAVRDEYDAIREDGRTGDQKWTDHVDGFTAAMSSEAGGVSAFVAETEDGKAILVSEKQMARRPHPDAKWSSERNDWMLTPKQLREMSQEDYQKLADGFRQGAQALREGMLDASMRKHPAGSRQERPMPPNTHDPETGAKLGPDTEIGEMPDIPDGRSVTTKEVQKWADVAMWAAPKHTDPQKPQVTITHAPEDPLGIMAMVNGMYTGKTYRSPAEVTDAERREAWEAATVSMLSQAPLEWFQLSILFENVTRGWTHQIVRTRMAGYAQESMRFAVKEDAADAVKLPPSLAGTVPHMEFIAEMDAAGLDPEVNASPEQRWRMRWDWAMKAVADAYVDNVNDGMPAEDARGMLPTNILTRIHQHIDIGTLKRMSGMRLCTQAQFEWRGVFGALVKALREYLPEDHPNRWQYELIAGGFRPVCFAAGKCTMKAKSDRFCSIRDQVDAFERQGIPSSQWEDPRCGHEENGKRIGHIRPEQWLADPTAARVAP